MMNDVRFLGGHGTPKPDGSRENPYNSNHTADPDPARRWDSQYPSLWVTDGGGGTFLDLWTPSTFAQAGMLVSDTETEGHVYQMSSEHHVRHEVQIRKFAWLDVSGRPPRRRPQPRSSVLARGAKLEKLAGGFFDISGGAAGFQNPVPPRSHLALCGAS